MVLELSDKRENGKTCWVPVVQKTYWPSPATSCSTLASTFHQGSSTSHSISDESSIQSSPCLRETRWKNPHPTKVLSQKDLESFSFRTGHREQCRYQWSQRRRPFRWLEQCHLKPVAECSECKHRWTKKGLARKSVVSVAARLLERALKKKLVVNSSVMDSIVSPRKRLLREMEKVRLHDRSSNVSCLKKAKAVSSVKVEPPSSARLHSSSPAKAYDRQSSYSIDSLLNTREEAAGSSSFLRSLLGKAPETIQSGSNSAINGARSKVRSEQRASELLLPLTLGMASPHALHPTAWLPYLHASSSFPAPGQPFQLPLASSLTALALATRPGPSSSDSRSGTYSGRMPTPPDECDEDDVPLNLSTSRPRDHS